MCGKFTAMLTWGEYCTLAGVGTSGREGDTGSADAMDPEKNLGTFTPMAAAPVLHLGPVRQRRITPMRWGWFSHSAADPARGFSHLHARSEEIDRTPTWSEPFRERRGVVFTKQFNIGEELPNGKVQQWLCSRADGKPMALAVLYGERETVQGPFRTFVMVTTASCPPLDMRDSRMPAILGENEVADWIGLTGASPQDLKALLRPFEGSLVMREQEPSGKAAKKPAPPKKPTPQPGLF
jgi:putative SOS response-associated peptidase YedK